MKIEVDKYYRHSDEVTKHIIEVPNNSLVVRIPWSEFGTKLLKYRGLSNEDDNCFDTYTSDYYIAFKSTDSNESIISYLEKTDCVYDDDILIMREFNEKYVLVRLISCDITNENFKLNTLDEINAFLPFRSQFYVEVLNDFNYNDYIKEIKKENGITTIDFMNDVDACSKPIFYYHPIKLDDKGVYTQIVGVNNRFKMFGDGKNNIIYHDSLKISVISERERVFDKVKVYHKNNEMITDYYGRVNEIIYKQ